jgi:hypothetical protein
VSSANSFTDQALTPQGEREGSSQRRGAIMSKRISIAMMATLLSLGAINVAQAGPRTIDDTNRHENKSTGG